MSSRGFLSFFSFYFPIFYAIFRGAVTGRDADERVIFVTVKESMTGNSDCIWQCPVMLLKYPVLCQIFCFGFHIKSFSQFQTVSSQNHLN